MCRCVHGECTHLHRYMGTAQLVLRCENINVQTHTQEFIDVQKGLRLLTGIYNYSLCIEHLTRGTEFYLDRTIYKTII